MAKNIPQDIERHPTDETRDKRGRMLAPLPGQVAITSANARTLAQKRWAKYRQSAANAITREAAAIDPTVSTPAGAWGLVTAKQYTTLMDSDKPRVDDLLKLGQIMGAMPTLHDMKQDNEGGSVLGGAQVSPVVLILAELRKRGGDVVIDGTVADA